MRARARADDSSWPGCQQDRTWDPDAWWDGDSYYALSGGSPGSGKPPTLFKSQDLRSWDYLGLFLSKDMPDVQADEDISCPNFFKLGNQHMLLCISHTLGCRYYLGQWKDEKFNPEFHAADELERLGLLCPRKPTHARRSSCDVGLVQSG
ncbi:MAG: hypothetical protein R3C56_17250 [Pirellulaceae bacterium]